MPQPDMFGICNNYKAPTFLQDRKSNQCQQSFLALEDGKTFLNPTYYQNFEYLLGSSPASQSNDITLGDVYRQDSTTLEVTKLSTGTYTFGITLASCTVTNFVKEIYYHVYYEAQESGNYAIDNIKMDLLIQDTLTLPASYCDNTATVPFNIQQRFNIDFQPYTTSTALLRSGNPGYQPAYPLLVGQAGSTGSGPKQVATNGFQIYSSD